MCVLFDTCSAFKLIYECFEFGKTSVKCLHFFLKPVAFITASAENLW